jgi:hypothetical protein
VSDRERCKAFQREELGAAFSFTNNVSKSDKYSLALDDFLLFLFVFVQGYQILQNVSQVFFFKYKKVIIIILQNY